MTTENGARKRARKRHPARRARTVAAGLGAAAVLGLAGIMGYGDLRGQSGESVPAAPTPPAVAAGGASAPPLVENEPIRLKARRVVRTVTVRGSAPAPSTGVARNATARPQAPVVTTGGSN